MKKCTHCGIVKDDEDFYLANNGKPNSKRKSQCKICFNELRKAYRSENKDIVNSKNRLYYYKHKERYRLTQKRYEQRILASAASDGIIYSKLLLKAAKGRARKYCLPFNITYEDIPIPEFCPVLGIKIERNNGKGHTENSASVDRIIPELGYVKGNVIVVSVKANTIKTNATPDEILKVGNYYKELMK
jgi:hypothetical protein